LPFSLIQQLATIPIVCLDVETTGASAHHGDRIIEIGMARYENGQKTAEYSQLINPQRRISAGITALTGISQEMCDGQPTFSQELPAMMNILAGAAILGHNVRFDLSFLFREFRRAGVDIHQATENAPVLDTVQIARRRFGRGGNGLGTLARRLGYEPPVAHRALADVITTAIIFEKLLEPVGGWNICLCDAIREQGGPIGLIPKDSTESLLPLELEEALENGRPVLMEYIDASRLRTSRVIRPLQIRRLGGEMVLIAHCELRNDRRNFKLDRIVQLRRMVEDSPTQAEAVPA
jgi:DNA polymerase III epsilon subunit family exonuclease